MSLAPTTPKIFRGTLVGKHGFQRVSREINNTLYSTRDETNQFRVFRAFLGSFTFAIHKFIHPVCVPSPLLKYLVGTTCLTQFYLTYGETELRYVAECAVPGSTTAPSYRLVCSDL